MLYRRNCEVCSHPFQASRRDARNCSPRCRRIAFDQRQAREIEEAVRLLRAMRERDRLLAPD